jgi:hypothetical protein
MNNETQISFYFHLLKYWCIKIQFFIEVLDELRLFIDKKVIFSDLRRPAVCLPP